MRFRSEDQLLLPWSPHHSISAQRAADILDLSVDTIYRMLESGELLGYKARNKPNSPWRVNYESLVAHVEGMHSRNGLEKRTGDEE